MMCDTDALTILKSLASLVCQKQSFKHENVDDTVLNAIQNNTVITLLKRIEARCIHSEETVYLLRCYLRLVGVCKDSIYMNSSNNTEIHSLEAQTQILDIILRYWNYFVEVVRHNCVDMFSLLLDCHFRLCCDCLHKLNCHWMRETMDTIVNADRSLRGKYRCLLALGKTTDFGTFFTRIGGLDSAEKMLDGIEEQSLTLVVADLYCYIAHRLTVSQSILWFEPLIQSLLCPESQNRIVLKEKLVPQLLGTDRNSFELFFAQLKQSENESSIYLDALISCCHLMLRHKVYVTNSMLIPTWNELISQKLLIAALFHADIQLSLSAFNLLIDHPRTTLIICADELQMVYGFLLANFNEQNPALRQQILAPLAKLLIRLRDSAEHEIKSEKDCDALVESYVDFIGKLVRLSFDSLHSGANSGRRSMALAVLNLILNMNYIRTNEKELLHNRLPFADWLSADHVTVLLTALADSYDVNHQTALDLLTLFNEKAFSSIDFSDFECQSWTLAKSNKPQDTYTSAYRFLFLLNQSRIEFSALISEILVQLELQISAAHKCLFSAAQYNPTHGLLHLLHQLIERRNLDDLSAESLDSIISVCLQISQIVSPVVHNISPEGYLPLDFIESLGDLDDRSIAKLHSINCQAILVNCWRSQKEICATFGTLAEKMFRKDKLSQKQIDEMGAYFWKQLLECKHRGAFETAYEYFAKLCSALWNAAEKTPKIWIEQLFDQIRDPQASRLCATRRSAGLPFLLLAILITEPNRESLEGSFNTLFNMASGQDEVQITHSCNCLRAIFRESKLSHNVMCYAGQALQLCIRIYSRGTWALRNAASLLFSALLVRIFGVPRLAKDSKIHRKNCLSSQEFFGRYPSLYPFLYEQLDSFVSSQTDAQSSMFLVLALLERIYESATASTWPLAVFVPKMLRICLNANVMHIRQLSAQVICSMAGSGDLQICCDIIGKIIGDQKDRISQNMLHGVLLVLSEWLKTSQQQCCQIKSILESLKSFLLHANRLHNYNIECLIDLANVCCSKCFTIDPNYLSPNLDPKPISSLFIAKKIDWKLYEMESIRPWKLRALAKMDEILFEQCIATVDKNCLLEMVHSADSTELEKKWLFQVLYRMVQKEVLDSDEIERLCLSLQQQNTRIHLTKARNAMLLLSGSIYVKYPESAISNQLFDSLQFSSNSDQSPSSRFSCVSLIRNCHFTNLAQLPVPFILCLLRLLQDDLRDIRKLSAETLSEIMSYKRPLNASICLRILVDYIYSTGGELERMLENYKKELGNKFIGVTTEDSDDRLFDKNESNAFIELEHLGQTSLEWNSVLKFIDEINA